MLQISLLNSEPERNDLFGSSFEETIVRKTARARLKSF